MSEEPRQEQRSFARFRYLDSRKCLIGPDGNEAELRAQSLAVFLYLASRADSVVSKGEIFSAVWSDVSVTDDSLVQCIADIRRMLGDTDRTVLRTLPRRGYMLTSDQPTIPAIPESTHQHSIPSKVNDSPVADARAWYRSRMATWILSLATLVGVGSLIAWTGAGEDAQSIPESDSETLSALLRLYRLSFVI